ncbi:MAG: bifunctional adenosylcobinamide kinase/adenosylcobinamide-phosphate guanylyltransferase [Eggerthellaceae bacterium]|nr:bifunctional adenosylcobinamide kinase/adenosylcobinamide-phosphate guanylyltransferase [Eggerthellaceae bacterium]
MILVVGGVCSGKRSYVVDVLGFDPSDISADPASAAPVVVDVQEAVRSQGGEELMPLLLSKRVVVCDEVGCGIVPVDPAERAWRERVGRLCCDLAAQAEAVVRMSCGIPQIIKGEL